MLYVELGGGGDVDWSSPQPNAAANTRDRWMRPGLLLMLLSLTRLSAAQVAKWAGRCRTLVVSMQPGDVVDGRFELEAQAGAGGMGTVFRARDRATGERVAVKVLRGEARDGRERFTREIRVLAGLRHPGIVRYVADGSDAAGM